MKNQKGLLFLLFCVFLFCAGRVAVFITGPGKKIDKPLPEAVGIAGDLQKVISDLETRLRERTEHEVNVTSDPLKLTRVIHGKTVRTVSGGSVGENLKKMRLSCTILSPKKSTAIIKFKGKSHILAVGDEINKRQVVAIDKKKVVLSFRGTQEILYNRPAPLAEIKYTQKVRLSDINL